MSSMRSRHTGQVGSSTRFGVGGGKGLEKLAADGVKGSCDSSGKLASGLPAVWKVMDLMNTTWHVSGYTYPSAKSSHVTSRGYQAHLHAVEHLPIPLSPPPPRIVLISKFHQHQVSIHPTSHDHPEMADQRSRLLTHKSQEITRSEIAGDRRNTKRRTVLFPILLFVSWYPSCSRSKPRALLAIAIEPHDSPSHICAAGAYFAIFCLGDSSRRRYSLAFCPRSKPHPRGRFRGRHVDRLDTNGSVSPIARD